MSSVVSQSQSSNDELRSSGAHDTAIILDLLEAMRIGDKEAIRAIISSYIRPGPSNKIFPLHMAVSSADRATTEFVLSLPEVNVNQQDHSGNTALHIGTSLGRIEIVKVLLKHEDIDDTLVNRDGKQPHQMINSDEILRLIEQNRREFVERRNSDVVRLISRFNIEQLLNVFSENRAKALLNLNLSEPVNGYSALHVAAISNDVDSVHTLLKLGVDVLNQDHKKNLPIDLTQCPKVKAILKQAMNASQVTIHSPGKVLAGFLQKWTNYASGYKARWFVLENGILSYYMNQTQTRDTCRGTINIRFANISMHKQDHSRFDITGPQSTKYHLRASHPIEAKRWVLALNQSKILSDTNVHSNEISTSTPIHFLSNNFRFPYTPDQSPTDSTFELTIHSSSLKIHGEKETSYLGLAIEDSNTSDDDSEKPSADFYWKVDAVINKLMAQQLDISRAVEELSVEEEKRECVQKSISLINSLVEDASNALREQDIYWRKKYARQSQKHELWVENFKKLAHENHELQMDTEIGTAMIEDVTTQVIPVEEEEEDEFYDAVDSVILKDNSSPVKFNVEKQRSADAIAASYKGYPGNLRTRLPIETLSSKPELSLWSVLANSIGKDLTKIALPVYFNEPTSMLQRLCEEMEYSELVDMATKHSDSLQRLLWVATFAMTNYSGSEHRIAKPFNPLLGETFEYVRIDKGYRYISEQVSHHPPISACHCESPNFIFYAEVDCKTKFWGKSFELFPAGLTHLYLKIPKAFVETEERLGEKGESDSETIQEHFSWKKVTTRVNNILIGKIYLENYGDMEIVNHRTGETCILTFKERKWGSSEKNIVQGVVKDRHGNIIWQLYGKWSEFLAARMATDDLQPFLDDKKFKCNEILPIPMALNNNGETSNPAILLWKRKKPSNIATPFNLTPFAITLNECPDTLLPYLAPTDSRLRPDQKALEHGEYELAQKEKMRLEEKQRAKRKKIEETPEYSWKPRWFVKDFDTDSQREFWRFTNQYWEERGQSNQKPILQDDDDTWLDVQDIF